MAAATAEAITRGSGLSPASSSSASIAAASVARPSPNRVKPVGPARGPFRGSFMGSSGYYTPGILFGQVGVHAALFVSMTLAVFVLLTIKYAEVAVRYPEGGGVVTVASSAIHPNVGLVGGLLILVDYFLTASLSALSGVIYLGVVAPGLRPVVVPLAALAVVALGGLNVMGVKSSAVVSATFPTA